MVSEARETTSAALWTTKFCTAGMSSSSERKTGKKYQQQNRRHEERNFPNIFYTFAHQDIVITACKFNENS
ncbi:MAG: hypothetical protein ACLSHL_09345 [Alistipes communis]